MANQGLQIRNLRKKIEKLKEYGCLVAIKTGTEIEDMGFDEILFLKKISDSIVPLIVKIGGPEARNDIRNCLKIRVDMILAPMVETVYALSNFVTSATSLQQEARISCELAINLESLTAYQNLDAMIQSTAFKSLQQVTIGRGDLSASMHLGLDDEEVINISAKAVRKIANHGKVTSVGGGFMMENIEEICHAIPAGRLNSRHCVIRNDNRLKKNPKATLHHVLSLEKELYLAMSETFLEKRESYLKRIKVLENRMGNLELVNAL